MKPLIGYMPDVLGVYDDMLVVEYLEFFAAAYRIRGEQRKRKIDEVLEATLEAVPVVVPGPDAPAGPEVTARA